MSDVLRSNREHVFTFETGATVSDEIELSGGCFGSIIVDSGSDAIGKTCQFVAVSQSGAYADCDMLATPKTLGAGNNALSSDEIIEVGSIGRCKLKLNSAVASETTVVLLWKS